MKSVEKKIGFDKIRERISLKCTTEYAKRRAENESYSTDVQEVERRISITDEMRLICMFESKFPQGGFTDCTQFLKNLEVEYSCISVENLRRLSDFSTQLRHIFSFLSSCSEEKYPFFREEAKKATHYPEIERRIELILDKNGEIKESASDKLSEICTHLRSTQNSIGRKIESILKKAKQDGIADEDATISIRDGKMLIPVASHNKKSISGVVQGESASGRTFFIEPIEVVEMNNRVRELEFERQREIARILAEFTEFLRPYLADLQISARFICEVDFIRAKAECAKSYMGGKPILSKEGILRIKEGRHPVLTWALEKENKKVVPIDIELNRNKHILIISGPNAGGKSVCLKTVGILQYMLQWGALVPCSEVSEFPIIKDIFVEIGDEQSIENDLSTYSSHLLNMRHVLRDADKDSLVLIDEFGSGTEPTAGGAIAETILEELEDKKLYGVITTHYTNLKVYAENSKGVINGAMLFDSAKIQPLYKLEIGVPGNSFAFDLARKMGLPEQIVKRAEEKAGSDFIDLEKQLRKISKNRKKLDEKLSRIKFTDKNLENITERYTKELSEIKQNKKEIIEQAKREAKQILESANKEIEATIKSIRESQAEKEKTKILRANLKHFSDSIEEEKSNSHDQKIEQKINQLIARKKRQEQRREKKSNNSSENKVSEHRESQLPKLQIGTKAKVNGSNLIGEIISIDKKSVVLRIGEISSRVKLSDIELISNKEFNNISSNSGTSAPIKRNLLSVDNNINQRKLEFKPEIDIRGQRLSEALDNVGKFIDDALLVGVSNLRILHGKGTGVLKEEIRKWLKTLPEVESFADEDIRMGGSGITVVKIK